MASRVAGKIKLQSVDELLGVPKIAGREHPRERYFKSGYRKTRSERRL